METECFRDIRRTGKLNERLERGIEAGIRMPKQRIVRDSQNRKFEVNKFIGGAG
jgi:hypothetical protein